MYSAKSLKQIGFTAVTAAIGMVALNATSADAFTIYTNRAAWEAAISGATIVTETFDNNIANAPTITFDSGVVSTGVNGTYDNLISSGLYVGRVDTSNDFSSVFGEIRWQFSSPIVAFGADWLGAVTNSGVTISGNFDGTVEQTVSINTVLGSPGSGFIGIVGDAAFSQIILREEGLNFGNEFFQADNLSVAAQSVPEPSTLLGLLAVTGVGAALKGRKKSSHKL